MKRNEVDVQLVCDKCGAMQKPDTGKSNSNWQVFDCGERCKCGGKFAPRFILEQPPGKIKRILIFGVLLGWVLDKLYLPHAHNGGGGICGKCSNTGTTQFRTIFGNQN